ncbi:MAG: RNA polymerase sigma factor [Planctomycetia bacterium]|nr:RNA polymerase sigma factor [Planctomycetia bacterium]
MHAPLRPESSDAQLVAAAAAGDRAAYQAVVQRHQQAIYGYLRARLIEPADVDDLCQEVFLRAYVALKKFSGEVSARPWLLGFARNVLREHLRRLKRRGEVLWTEMCLYLDTCGSPDDGPFDEVIDRLPNCLAGLGPTARQAIELRYSGELSHATIAQRLCRSPDAVKLLLYRARRALKRCLELGLSGGAVAEA